MVHTRRGDIRNLDLGEQQLIRIPPLVLLEAQRGRALAQVRQRLPINSLNGLRFRDSARLRAQVCVELGIRVEHGVAPRAEDGLRVRAVQMLFHAVHGGPSGAGACAAVAVAVGVVLVEGACESGARFRVFGRGDGDAAAFVGVIVVVGVVWGEELV